MGIRSKLATSVRRGRTERRDTPWLSGCNKKSYNDKPEHQHQHEKLSTTGLVVNIIADLCPHGMMPLAYGFAHRDSTGWAMAITLVIVFGSMSAYTMGSYAKMAQETNSASIGEIWRKVVSPTSEWMVNSAILALCGGCCVFYSAFIGDIFSSLSAAAGLPPLWADRRSILLLTTLGVLLPLCLLEDLSALKFSSSLGAAGILVTVGFHVLRYWDGSYQEGSQLLQSVPLPFQPRRPGGGTPRGSGSSGSSGGVLPSWAELFRAGPGTLVLVNMLCVAFLSHYNAINYYGEFQQPAEAEAEGGRNGGGYSRAVQLGFAGAALVFIIMMAAGYLLFGAAAQPLLLNNFPASADRLASVARLATGLAITFAYPLMFAGLKTSLFDLLEGSRPNEETPFRRASGAKTAVSSTEGGVKKGESSSGSRGGSRTLSRGAKAAATTLSLGAITAVAAQCGEHEVSFVLGVVGSVLGCFVAYVLPAGLKLALLRRQRLEAQKEAQKGQEGQLARGTVPDQARRGTVGEGARGETSAVEEVMNYVLVITGAAFGALGVYITLSEGQGH
jgi:amino acid permease